MKANDFVQALGQIDEKYIEETLRYKPGNFAARGMRVWRTVAIAACALLALSAAFGIISLNSGRQSSDDSYVSGGSSDYYYSAQEMSGDTNYYAPQASDSFAAGEKAAIAGYAADIEEDYEGFYEEEAAYEYETAAETAAYAQVSGSTANAAQGTDTAQGDVREKKIIYNVYMDMQTREFDDTVKSIESLADEMGGYCEDQYISNSYSGYRNASYTFRIPADKLEEFLDRTGKVSTVTSINRSAQDVSSAYYDTQSRLDSARIKLGRLQELMNQAENMEDLITIESAITDVEWEIDNYGSTITYYDSQVAYSTVSMTISEVYEVVVDEAPLSFGERISHSFQQGMRSIGTFFRNLVIWLAGSWIWLAVVIIIIVILICLIAKAKQRRKEKRSEQMKTDADK